MLRAPWFSHLATIVAQHNPEPSGDGWTISTVPVLIALAGALLLFGTIRALRGFLPRLALPRVWRERFARWGPIVELFVWSIYVAVSVAWLLDGSRIARIVLLAAGGVLVVVAAFFAIRDYLAGVIVRMERFARVGDEIQVGDTTGTVASLGTRFAVIRAANGDEVLMPYSQLGRGSMVRTQRGGAAPRHTFTVRLPEGINSADAQETAHNAALLNHWAAPKHDPIVRPRDHKTLEITVQPIVAIRADDLEIAVRQALDELVAAT